MDKTEIFTKLIHRIKDMHGTVMFIPMESSAEGLLIAKCDTDGNPVELNIGIRSELDFDKYIYNLAHELAHYYLHFDKVNTIKNENRADFEEQADRAAKMLLDVLSQE